MENLGYNVYDSTVAKTDMTKVINKFTKVNREFPNIIIGGETVQMYKLKVLKEMLINGMVDGNRVSVYLEVGGKVTRAGYIASYNVSRLIDLFKDDNEITGHLNETKELKDNMLYILASWK